MEKTVTIKIPFYDVDPMQVAWHGNYLKYLEEARCAFLEEIGLSYTTMAELGFAAPVILLQIKYIKPCRFGQLIDVKAELVSSDNLLIFKYLITDSASLEKLCKAETKQMVVDLKTKESLFELPQPFLRKLQVGSK